MTKLAYDGSVKSYMRELGILNNPGNAVACCPRDKELEARFDSGNIKRGSVVFCFEHDMSTRLRLARKLTPKYAKLGIKLIWQKGDIYKNLPRVLARNNVTRLGSLFADTCEWQSRENCYFVRNWLDAGILPNRFAVNWVSFGQGKHGIKESDLKRAAKAYFDCPKIRERIRLCNGAEFRPSSFQDDIGNAVLTLFALRGKATVDVYPYEDSTGCKKVLMCGKMTQLTVTLASDGVDVPQWFTDAIELETRKHVRKVSGRKARKNAASLQTWQVLGLPEDMPAWLKARISGEYRKAIAVNKQTWAMSKWNPRNKYFQGPQKFSAK